MAIYAIAIRPLIELVATAKALQVWFADDAAGGGKLNCVRGWWDLLQQHGPKYGYFVNAAKTWLLVKPESLSAAEVAFANTGVQVTTRGVKHLGAPLGDRDYVKEYVSAQVMQWVKELALLSHMAKLQPHLAFCALRAWLVSGCIFCTP